MATGLDALQKKCRLRQSMTTVAARSKWSVVCYRLRLKGGLRSPSCDLASFTVHSRIGGPFAMPDELSRAGGAIWAGMGQGLAIWFTLATWPVLQSSLLPRISVPVRTY